MTLLTNSYPLTEAMISRRALSPYIGESNENTYAELMNATDNIPDNISVYLNYENLELEELKNHVIAEHNFVTAMVENIKRAIQHGIYEATIECEIDSDVKVWDMSELFERGLILISKKNDALNYFDNESEHVACQDKSNSGFML